MTLGLLFVLRANGVSNGALAPSFLGAVALAAVAPFKAYDLKGRMRVFLACAIYTILALFSSAVVLSAYPMFEAAFVLVGPALGLGLTIWAYNTRKRKRNSRFAGYLSD
ncbi:hypothetical protein OKW76_11800 [Sphingomonas sp. S1-29]|uniref:hypothetical protein n=1 Tax=Sphingomonas sp. S1-29 TaxID=2991074 RepID=UPI00223F856B|nr:hypothetical protein [Sphingomonas sp. S1-29]UZK68720.1 hypothetical protein OKW76_11800 [Sphingomonas sp. S1-29]